MLSEYNVYQTSLCPSLFKIKTVRSEVASVLTKFQLCDRKKNNVLLALSEYLTNIVKHAKPSAERVLLSILIENNKLVFKIRDNGPFFTGLIRQGNQHQVPVFAESGMGVDILFYLFPRLKYAEKSGWNCCEFVSELSSKFAKHSLAVIDDEPMQRKLLESYLSHSYEVICFESANQFLLEISHQHFDIVLCDIEMPGMNGLELKRKIKQDHVMSQVPFVFLTGNDDPNIESMASELGIDNFLTKPIRKEKLLLALSRVITRNKDITNLHNEVITSALKPTVKDDNPHFHMSAGSYTPGSGGGDFIVQKKVGDKTFVILADVMGHDVRSKLFAHSFDGFIKGLMEQANEICIADIFSTLSRQVFEDPLLTEMLLTCVGIEITADYLDIVCAGHPNPWLIDGPDIEPIVAPGQLPGLSAQTQYQTSRVQLSKGQRLFLYTDGLMDCLKNEKMKDNFVAEISKITQSQQLQKTQQQVDAVLSALIAHIPQPKDDITVMILEKI